MQQCFWQPIKSSFHPLFYILYASALLKTTKAIAVKILSQDFEEVRAIFRDQRLDQGADVGPEEKCSDLMILFHWQIARINRKQQRAQNVVEKTNK